MQVRCPWCQTVVRVPDDGGVASATCPACGKPFARPAPAPLTPPEAQPPAWINPPKPNTFAKGQFIVSLLLLAGGAVAAIVGIGSGSFEAVSWGIFIAIGGLVVAILSR
ncbi:MAG: hypothetical protein IJ783_05750 [Kiritimatiellae bacterium]|nr:hypothetical protein [Kiritimatiellia bacterium]MBR1836772.1 hypothetical protein [Kiritimatiellia bacterium]